MNHFTAPSFRRRLVPLAVAAAWCAVVAGPVRADEITRHLQEELRRRNLFFGDVDGRASAQLSAALHRYQERKGFTSTGEADADTLFSLNIQRPGQVPSRPDIAVGTGATDPPPAATPPALDARSDGAAPWPDVTVLRSDEARPAPATGDADARLAGEPKPLSSPTPAPPPAASGTLRRPTPEQVGEFLTRYLQAGATNDPDAEMRFYGERVSYYDEGVVERPYILRDVTRYDRRWPERRFTLLDPVTITASPDGDPDKFVVNFRYGFHVKGSRYLVSGKTDNVWTVAGSDPAHWKIVSMKEQRVREK